MTDRVSIIEKILNLRALGDSTSSEAEAVAAFRAAERLMRGYEVEEAELALAESLGEVVIDIVSEYGKPCTNGRNRHKVQVCLWDIESYCEVECVLKPDGRPHWIGHRPDVEMAMYLTDVIQAALDNEYDRWRKTQGAVGRGAKGSFQTSMARRLNERLRAMKAARAGERQRAMDEALRALPGAEEVNARAAMANGSIRELTSTALVVMSAVEEKKRRVEDAFKTAYAGMRLGTASSFPYGRNGSAHSAGAAAASRVGLGRPVGASAQQRIA